jgi:PleD family two-component response regulator
MNFPLQILILEDSTEDADLMRREILNGNLDCRIPIVIDKNRFLTAIEENTYDIILSDNCLPHFTRHYIIS